LRKVLIQGLNIPDVFFGEYYENLVLK